MSEHTSSDPTRRPRRPRWRSDDLSGEAPPVSDEIPAPPWGVGEVVLATVVTFAVAAVLVSLMLGAAGVDDSDDASLVLVALGSASLWVGMIGSILVVLRLRGGDLRRDLRLEIRAVDLPVGIVLGVASQLLLVPAVSWPWTRLLGADSDELREPACRLAEKADDPVGVALLFLITVIGAPIVEEMFFRGFAQRPLVARLGHPAGVVITALLFGLVHFQPLQFPALVAFGLVLGVLADRFRRLGPGIVAHMAFNATTVVGLLVLSSSVDDACKSVLG